MHSCHVKLAAHVILLICCLAASVFGSTALVTTLVGEILEVDNCDYEFIDNCS